MRNEAEAASLFTVQSSGTYNEPYPVRGSVSTDFESKPDFRSCVPTELRHLCSDDDGSDQQTPENAAWDILVARAEDEVELDHLERNGEGPIDVTVESGSDVVSDLVDKK